MGTLYIIKNNTFAPLLFISKITLKNNQYD